jgi:rhodanese-related sulfurtransferase
MREITPRELSRRLDDDGTSLLLLDVREAEERAICQLAGAMHVPMGDVPARLHELDPDREIVVYCHHGQRSAAVVAFLERHEFANVANLAGGIDRWALEVDPTTPRY